LVGRCKGAKNGYEGLPARGHRRWSNRSSPCRKCRSHERGCSPLTLRSMICSVWGTVEGEFPLRTSFTVNSSLRRHCARRVLLSPSPAEMAEVHREQIVISSGIGPPGWIMSPVRHKSQCPFLREQGISQESDTSRRVALLTDSAPRIKGREEAVVGPVDCALAGGGRAGKAPSVDRLQRNGLGRAT
jgi:hypothetical protein